MSFATEWPDFINGLFEVFGSVFVWANAWAMRRSKHAWGPSVVAALFFTVWGYWNLFFYSHYDLWVSWAGGIPLVLGSTVWVGLAAYYTHKERFGKVRVYK